MSKVRFSEEVPVIEFQRNSEPAKKMYHTCTYLIIHLVRAYSLVC